MDIVKGEITYERLRKIGVGEGANSVVYEARERNVGRTVAVKEIDKADLSVRGIYDFFKEAKTMFEVRHPHVVPIHTAVDVPGIVGLVMPLYPAGSLASIIASGPLSLPRTTDIAQGVLEGLAHIHIAKFLHFDIKPSNVLFAPAGQPMVSDFGQTRMLDIYGVAEAPAMYRFAPAPEVYLTGRGTVESDVFQAGLLLYRMVNGEPFYQNVKALQLLKMGGPDECLRKGRIVDPERFLPHVPNRLRRIIRTAMHPDPAERYSSAQQLADALTGAGLLPPWEMSFAPDRREWRLARRGKATLLVIEERIPGRERWSVSAFTEGNAGTRGLRRSALWATSLTANQAEHHLRQRVFRVLERG